MAAIHLVGRRAATIAILAIALFVSGHAFQATDQLPAQLSDEAYWKLVTDFSETSGVFGSENFVSNERSFQEVLDELAQGRRPASAYIGVGPEQNFTYIHALKPRIAFIVDIRRQNLLEHLLYKALFELSADRGDFLSRLFSRPRPDDLRRTATTDDLFDAFRPLPADPLMFQDTLQTVKTHLTVTHGFTLSNTDELGVERVLRAFAVGGQNLTYEGPGSFSGIYPTFEEIMLQTDKLGAHRSFLASHENFVVVQELQKKNLLIPVVGDFAGEKALKAVGEYLKDHGATVTSFYTSNVEQYLFMNGVWPGFYKNVSALPIDDKSVFIRGLIRSAGGTLSASPVLPRTSRYETVLFSIPDLVGAFSAGTIQRYNDIVASAK